MVKENRSKKQGAKENTMSVLNVASTSSASSESSVKYPLVPMRDVVVFPYMVLPVFVGRKRSIRSIEEAVTRDRRIVLCSQKLPHSDDPESGELYEVATLADVHQVLKMPDGLLKLVLEGVRRVRIHELTESETFFEARVTEYVDDVETTVQMQALMRNVNTLFEQYIKVSKRVPLEIIMIANNISEPGRLADTVASNVVLKVEEKQEILEAFDPFERLDKLAKILNRELEILVVERKIRGQVRKQMEQVQKEFYLREQIKAIQKELGEDEDRIEEAEELKKSIEKAGMTPEAKDKALKELAKLRRIMPGSPEGSISRNYLEWLLALPWKKQTRDRVDLNRSQEILDEDHFGLEKIKERIIEYLAVCQLKKSIKGPILCLIGPPGVGKTSLGRSIARSLGRKFARISLGGMRDEAEIRGHRRTYIGALPGRIIQAMRDTGTKNPVILLDEIDKMSRDFRGDPSSALLEALDPEQNINFSDHYISTPYDLSKVLFLTTANVPHTIPGPLRDRLEVVYIPGYTEEEKVQIAKSYLIPKQIDANGVKKYDVDMDDKAVVRIIREYTREAGVRNLDREIASVFRKLARDIVLGKKATKVTSKNVTKYLGIPKYQSKLLEGKDAIGLVNGLAWTEVGGTTLPIEVAVMPGKGKIILTGSLGAVMKESAHASLSYLRSHAEALKMRPVDYDSIDLHIHFPEGAVPKDGPSAGIAITTAIYSALNEVPVRNDYAMTGEITLRGRVLAVGGIKEKLLAAHRYGIKNIILSTENEKELEEIPKDILKNLKIYQVSTGDEALKLALNGQPKRTPLSYKKKTQNSKETKTVKIPKSAKSKE
jgi:ATP-dependent Lon protease